MTAKTSAAQDRMIERLLDDFDRAWHSEGPPPSIQVFADEGQKLGIHSPELIRELVRIDAEYRWKVPGRAGLLPLIPGTTGGTPSASDYRDALSLEGDLAWLRGEITALRAKFAPPPEQQWGESSHLRTRQFISEPPRSTGSVPLIDALHPADPRKVNQPVGNVSSTDTRYQSIRKLGEGAFGEVWLARDTLLDRMVAVKTLKAGLMSAKAMANLLHEARAAAAVKHPHLVAVYDIVSSPKGIHLVMEYVDGETFQQWSHGRSSDEKLRVLADVADAVHAAHLAGLIHCDLKPANVLVDRRGHAWVTDFGFTVREEEQAHLNETRFGTPAFLSPEQVRGDVHHIDGRTDIWALGVILYWTLVDRLPFNGDSLTELMDEIEFRPAKPLRQIRESVAADVEAICLRCLRKNPEDRYSTASDVASAIRGIVSANSFPSSSVREYSLATVPRTHERMIGRDHVLEEVRRLLQSGEAQLLTLTGPGGIGKTRLAVAVAETLSEHFSGGVVWVDLTTSQDEGDICEAVRSAIRLPAPAGHESAQQIGDALALRGPMLLILDNCEGTVSSLAGTAGLWSKRIATLSLLATSQVPLGLMGERRIALQPLALPCDQAVESEHVDMDALQRTAAVQLFAQRAIAAGSPLASELEEWTAAAEICRRLDGLPLAIELAAARLPLLGVHRVAHKLRETFDFLRNARRDAPARHQTLAAAVQWSISLLQPAEQQALAYLSQWPAAMPAELCEQLLGVDDSLAPAALDCLQELQDRSVLRSSTRSGVVWLEVPEVVRRIAGQDAAHDQWIWLAMLSRLVNFWQQQRTARSEGTHDEATIDNLWHACKDYCRLNDSQGAINAATSADRIAANHTSALKRLERLEYVKECFSGCNAPELDLALADACQAAANYAAAIQWASAAVNRAEREDFEADARACLADAAFELGDYPRAMDESDQAISVYRSLDRAAGLARMLALQGRVAWRTGDLPRANHRFDEATLFSLRVADSSLRGEIMRDKGNVLLLQGHADDALKKFLRAERLAEQSGDLRAVQRAVNSHAAALTEQGNYLQAESLFARAEEISRRLGDRRGLAKIMNNRALAMIDRGDPAAALDLLQDAECLNRECGHTAGIAIGLAAQGAAYLALEQPVAALQKLDEALQQSHLGAGTWHDAAVRGDRGEALRLLGRTSDAITMLVESLQILERLGAGDSPEAFLAHVQLALIDNDAAASHASIGREIAARAELGREHPRRRVRLAIGQLQRVKPGVVKNDGNA